MQRIKNPLGSSRRGGLGAGPAWLKYDSRRTARPPPITAGSPAPARRGSPSISAGVHGGFRVDDEQTTAAAPGAGGQGMAERVRALRAERERQQREEADDIAEHIAHEAQFMTVGEFGQQIVHRHRLPHHEAWPLAYEVLKSHQGLELFCRWEESFRWSPLPPCPVAPASRLRDKNARYYNGKFGHMGPTYMHPVRGGAIPSPDPLGSALGQCQGTGWWPTDCLAVRRDVAEQLLGVPAQADGVELTPEHRPALAVVQSEPAPVVELQPTKKPGTDWTPADYAELLRQYESLTSGPDAMKGEVAREALGKVWSYAPNSIKPFLTTARKQRGATI